MFYLATFKIGDHPPHQQGQGSQHHHRTGRRNRTNRNVRSAPTKTGDQMMALKMLGYCLIIMAFAIPIILRHENTETL
jgi:hypothetical protein